jgi:hypothetical protein
MDDPDIAMAEFMGWRRFLGPEGQAGQAAVRDGRMDPSDPNIPLVVWMHELATKMLCLSLTVLSVKIQLAQNDPVALLAIAAEIER